ncbi:MAG: hypothetical protein JW720_13390 [Sedimentisphaerales bacterium]|nr:hypothetical protein [Sedimentisphaerales bacterium]
MAEAGMAIVAAVMWFQFIMTQLVAIVMMSTSISDEIYHKTLGLLMTTPINSFQIVVGKLLSKLLQLVLLMVISLPLLAIVRVFGGVPWGYIISGLCVTLTAVLFAGSVSLFFSILSRRAYVVIILAILTFGTLFALIPVLGAMIFISSDMLSEGEFFRGLTFVNPYFCLIFMTEAMMSARTAALMGGAAWMAECIVFLLASGLLLLISVAMVRRVALRQAVGQLGSPPPVRPQPVVAGGDTVSSTDSLSAPRRVTGSAILWKELKSPLLGRRKVAFLITIAVGLILLFMTYAFFANEDALDDDDVHILYGVVFVSLGTLFTIILPATCITSEKESLAWPLLLTTTLGEWQILGGKFAGVVRRCLPVWCLLFGHIVLFILAGVIHPIALFQVGILVAWIVVFLSASGLYFSTRFRRTTTAVIVNFTFAAAIWAVIPLLMFLVAEIDQLDYDLLESYLDTNPFVHIVVILSATAGHGGLDSYYWMDISKRGASQATLWMLACMIGYMFLGLLFAWRARYRLRRNVF